MLDHLGRFGIPALAACSPADAQRLVRQHPAMILVDLVHGAGLDGASVAWLNRSRGSAVVVALHAGDLGDFYEPVEDLAIDGFCRFDDWQTIAMATPSEHMSFALH